MTTLDLLIQESGFLVDRLTDFEREHVNGLDGEREEAYQAWGGNVVPSIERMRILLAQVSDKADGGADA